MKVLTLLSGGMDSATLATMLQVQDSYVQGLVFDYGSKHAEREIYAALKVADRLGIDCTEVSIDEGLWDGGGSSLMGQADIPDTDYDLAKLGPSNTVVPFRNAILVSMAVAIASSQGLDAVAIATHATDAAHWAYPDCTPEFVGAMTAAVYVGTYHKVRLLAPFTYLTKADIVAKAAEVHAPLELTWSCYRGGDYACGTCPTCRERLRAFQVAGYVDPILYVQKPNWFGCEPWQLAFA